MVLSDVDIRRYLEQGKIRVLSRTSSGAVRKLLDRPSPRLGIQHFRTQPPPLHRRPRKERDSGPHAHGHRQTGRTLYPAAPGICAGHHGGNLELDDDVLGRLEGRSSLGRIGIIVHGTAGLFDPGWRGKATLELSNLGIMPVALYPGMRICSFTFEQLSSPVSVPYYKKVGKKYAGQTQPLASKLTSEVNRKE